MNVEFQHVSSQHIRDCFMKAIRGFPELQRHRLIVRQQPMRVTTMQAQPVLNQAFSRKEEQYYMSADEVALMVQKQEKERLRMDRLL
ncbi:MAG: hypothetical protein KDD10_05600 [Phaeodactylibacter sp.]|nr:hypothetical protein [Phaeodactylibacter sp.]MCB9292619.1 hypothetical protein [Lewinellaceae bacterium]